MAVKQIANIKAICDRDALVEAMNLITGVVAGRTQLQLCNAFLLLEMMGNCDYLLEILKFLYR